MRWPVWVLLLSLVALPAYGQQAAPPPDQRELTARQMFAVGKYSEALEIYGRLYAETAHPTYLRNIARCYQNMGEPDRAISSFSEYLRQARDLPADQRAIIDGYIREMEEMRRKRAATPAPQATAPAAAPAPQATAPAAQAPAAATMSPPFQSPAPPPAGADVTAPAATPDPERARSARRKAAYAVGGASLAALAVGGFFGARAILKRQESDPNCPMDVCNDAGWPPYQQAKTAARVADVTIGVGLLGAGVATYLFLTSRPQAQERSPSVARQFRIEPVAGPNQAGLLVGASW